MRERRHATLQAPGTGTYVRLVPVPAREVAREQRRLAAGLHLDHGDVGVAAVHLAALVDVARGHLLCQNQSTSVMPLVEGVATTRTSRLPRLSCSLAPLPIQMNSCDGPHGVPHSLVSNIATTAAMARPPPTAHLRVRVQQHDVVVLQVVLREVEHLLHLERARGVAAQEQARLARAVLQLRLCEGKSEGR